MEKKLDGHIVGFGELQYWEEYEEWIWLGGAMSEERYNAYKDTPCKEECDRMCAELSGEVVVSKIKNP